MVGALASTSRRHARRLDRRPRPAARRRRSRTASSSASAPIDPDAATAFLDQHYAEIGAAGGRRDPDRHPAWPVTGTVEGQVFTADPLAGLTFSIDATVAAGGR